MTAEPAETDLVTRLNNIRPGERIVYFTGYMSATPYYQIASVKDAAWRLQKQGRAVLVQKAVGTTCINRKTFTKFEYIAIGCANT
jgi:hypothetical protein